MENCDTISITPPCTLHLLFVVFDLVLFLLVATECAKLKCYPVAHLYSLSLPFPLSLVCAFVLFLIDIRVEFFLLFFFPLLLLLFCVQRMMLAMIMTMKFLLMKLIN